MKNSKVKLPDLVSRREAAHFLGISLPTLSKLTADGKFKSYLYEIFVADMNFI